MDNRITNGTDAITEYLDKQEKTEDLKVIYRHLEMIKEGVSDLLAETSDLQDENYELEIEIGNIDEKIEYLEYTIEEVKRRVDIKPNTINDELKINIIEDLYKNLSLDELEKIQKEVISSFEQEGKTYLSF